jgi:hypothetical protein
VIGDFSKLKVQVEALAFCPFVQAHGKITGFEGRKKLKSFIKPSGA